MTNKSGPRLDTCQSFRQALSEPTVLLTILFPFRLFGYAVKFDLVRHPGLSARRLRSASLTSGEYLVRFRRGAQHNIGSL